ncbi:hypothetical protein D3C76_1699250 [compost metagenome]
MRGRQWLFAEHVQHGAGQLPLFERVDQIPVDHCVATTDIDEQRIARQRAEKGAVE